MKLTNYGRAAIILFNEAGATAEITSCNCRLPAGIDSCMVPEFPRLRDV